MALFFTDFGSAMEVDEFTPATSAANETEVFTHHPVPGQVAAHRQERGDEPAPLLPVPGRKIAYFRGTEDTAQTEAVLRD